MHAVHIKLQGRGLSLGRLQTSQPLRGRRRCRRRLSMPCGSTCTHASALVTGAYNQGSYITVARLLTLNLCNSLHAGVLFALLLAAAAAALAALLRCGQRAVVLVPAAQRQASSGQRCRRTASHSKAPQTAFRRHLSMHRVPHCTDRHSTRPGSGGLNTVSKADQRLPAHLKMKPLPSTASKWRQSSDSPHARTGAAAEEQERARCCHHPASERVSFVGCGTPSTVHQPQPAAHPTLPPT